MVLIHPEIIEDSSKKLEGRLRVSFPVDSGCEAFSIPLVPSSQTLERWERLMEFYHPMTLQHVDG